VTLGWRFSNVEPTPPPTELGCGAGLARFPSYVRAKIIRREEAASVQVLAIHLQLGAASVRDLAIRLQSALFGD